MTDHTHLMHADAGGAMSAVTELREFRDHLTEVDRRNFLGSLVIFTVRDTSVPYLRAKAQLEAVGLGAAVPTSPPCDTDVFRRVFFQGQRRRIVLAQDRVRHLLVRDVKKSPEKIVKHIVVEEVDQAGQRLSYDEAMSCTFDTTRTHTVEFAPISGSAHLANDLAQDLLRDYQAERGTLDGNGVRNMIQRALEACYAVSMREGGGVFFVSSRHDQAVAGIESIAAHIPGVSMTVHPIIDDRKQQANLRAAFVSEVTTDVEKLMAEVAEALGSEGTITARKYRSFQRRYEETMAKVREYRGVLEENITDASLRLDLLGMQVSAALGKVR